MASSQVEIASTSPFGCVLRDRNARDGCRESNVFQRNIKNFVMDHLKSMSSDSATNENNNNHNNQMNNDDSWISKASKINNLGRLSFTRSNYNNNTNNKDKDESCLASLISPRHSRLLDRWAARQAREMVSTLENEAELLAMPNPNNNNNNMLARTCSDSSCDDVSSEISSTLGASSLVQIWEKRLNQSNGSKPNTPVSTTNALFSVEEQNREEQNRGGSEAGESSASSSYHEPPQGSEEPFPDWESDKMLQSDQSISPQGRFSSSETTESDRVSVQDIIKRLIATNQGQSPPHSIGDENDHEGWSSSVTCSPCRERECGFTPELSENKAFLPQVTCPPRIRGRRAFHDLLMQLERDRHGELNNLAERGAVSKFTQRGRIQSLLRLRLLQRGVAAMANDQSRQKSKETEVNIQPQGSAIMQLRERFSIGVDNRTTVQAEVAEPRSSPRKIENNTVQFETSPSTNQLSKDTCSQNVHRTANHSSESTQKSLSQASVDHNKEETHPSSDAMFQETCFEARRDDLQETSEATPSITDSNLNEMADKVETSNQEYTMAETSYDETLEEEENSNQHYAETSYDETLEEEEETSNHQYAESSYDEIEEEVEAIEMNYDETSYDWISEISRPRSYWEERRQAWYTEMLDTESHNEDIRKLLERRTVSTFLSSDFRDRMDKLMESHRGTQTHLVTIQDEVEDNQALIAFLQERLHSASSPQEHGRERVVEREEEEEERGNEEEEDEQEDEQEEKVEEQDYFNQSSSTHLTTWSYRDNETGDDFDRVASTSSQPSESQSFCQDSRRNSSSTNNHSIEMELIYDLRGQMEQLYLEMSELRKSMKSCMDMQMQLQQSKNQEVQTVKKEEKKSHNNRGLKKGNCCICYEMKVDALLYRCGHMCACLKCANELQWNSGKCPICRATIVDVVRVYVDF